MWSPTRWIGRRREPLRVACTSDEGYLPHCAATLHSVIVSQPGPVEAHLLAGPHTADIALGHAEIQLERVGPADREQQIALLECAAGELLDVWCQHHAAHRRPERGQLDLLVQQGDLTS